MQIGSELKAITLDMGDTLVEIRPAIHQCAHDIFQGLGLSCTVQDVQDALGRAWLATGEEYMACGGELFESFWAHHNVVWLRELGIEEDLEGLVERLAEGFAGVQFEASLPEQVPGILAELRERGYLLGIISNWDPTLEAYCQKLGITDYFTCILASEAVGVGKPSPRIFEMALERLGVAPAEALHVGDNYYADVLGARRVGMEALLLDRHGLFPHADCRRLRELGELLSLV